MKVNPVGKIPTLELEDGTAVYDSPVIIEYLSGFTNLSPGDVIATGTPGGVGDKREPPVYMNSGDVIEVEITGLGILRNVVVNAGIGSGRDRAAVLRNLGGCTVDHRRCCAGGRANAANSCCSGPIRCPRRSDVNCDWPWPHAAFPVGPGRWHHKLN